MSKTIVGYGFNRTKAQLVALGCSPHHIYIDTDKKRPHRKEMLERGIRKGDVVRVFYIRDLGGSPSADKKAVAQIEARDARVDECRPVSGRAPGRPAKLNVPDDRAAQCWDIWHDKLLTEGERLSKIGAILRQKVNRGAMMYRYGSQGSPKTRPETKD